MSFIPENFEVPTGGSNYTKLEEGETRIRILSQKAIFGYEVWSNKKPYRYKSQSAIDVTPDKNLDGSDGKVRRFLAFIVWNYNTESVEACSITQSSVMTAIDQLSNDPDFGDPTGYDIKITKKGKGMETKYTVIAVPPKPVAEEIKKAYAAKPGKLENLFASLDVFMASEEATAPMQPTFDQHVIDEKLKEEAIKAFG